jgi:hypothetical protein
MHLEWRRKIGVIGLSAAILLAQAAPALADEGKSSPASKAIEGAGSAGTAGAGAAAGGGDTVRGPEQVEAKISREQAVELARSYAAVPDDYALEGVSFNSSEGRGEAPRWNLSFTKQVNERYYGQIYVSVNAETGQLLQYDFYERDSDRRFTYPPDVDYTEAKAIAESFIHKTEPDKANRIVFDQRTADRFKVPLQGDITYPIRFLRVENGLPYENNYIRMSIDGDGHIRSYRIDWDDRLTFADPSGVISEEEALEAVTALGPRLSYRIPYGARERRPYLTYSLPVLPIDAVTGEPLQPVPEENSEPLTPKPLASMPEGGLKLTKEQAVERVRAHFAIPDEAVLENASYQASIDPVTGEERALWNLSWSVRDGGEERTERFWASIEGDTGIIRSYDHSRYVPKPLPTDTREAAADEKAGKPAVTQAEAEQLAVEIVKEVLPFYTDQLVLQPQVLTDAEIRNLRAYRVIFHRVIDGVPAGSERVHLTFDAETGELTSFMNDLSDIAYPAERPEAIPAEEAERLLLQLYDLVLQYEWTPDPDGISGIPTEKLLLMMAAGEIPPVAPDEANSAAAEAKPVYRLMEKYREEPVFLDAATGEWRLLETGAVTALEKPEPTDIAGHWAENELRLMLAYDALDVQDGKVLPDRAITRGEMIKMLVIAIRGGNHPIVFSESRAASFKDVAADSDYFAYVETAVDMNLLDRGEEEFHPTDTITREQLAGLIVKALGYAKLAEVEGLFALDAADRAEMEQVGPVAIVTSLGIMTLDGNRNFRPGEEVTRAQAAAAFHRFLVKREALRDTPL